MTKILILTGYFLAVCVDKEPDGVKNILLESLTLSKGRDHTMIAHWDNGDAYKQGKIYSLRVESECSDLGKSSLQEQYKQYFCNASKVLLIEQTTLNCEDYSKNCKVCE